MTASVFLAATYIVLANISYVIPYYEEEPGIPGGVELDVTVEGNGEINISPPGQGCYLDQTCTFGYASGTQVRLAAIPGALPDTSAGFVGWDGDCVDFGREQYPVLVMDTSKKCLARFTPPP